MRFVSDIYCEYSTNTGLIFMIYKTSDAIRALYIYRFLTIGRRVAAKLIFFSSIKTV